MRERRLRPPPLTRKHARHSPWHFCDLTKKAEAGTFEDCSTCRIRKGNHQEQPIGILGLLSPELRNMVYDFLIPAPLPLSTEKDFQDEGRRKLADRIRVDVFQNLAGKQATKQQRQRSNPLNIMATSKAVYAEIKNLPAFWNRLYSVTFTYQGMSFENSLPQIDPFASDRQKLLEVWKKGKGRHWELRWPFMALCTISPRRLHVTFPISISEQPTLKGPTDSNTIGVSLTALSQFFGLLKNDPAIRLKQLHIRLFLFDQENRPWSSLHLSAGVGAWVRRMFFELVPLLSVRKEAVQKVTISVDSDQPESQHQPWWATGLEVIAKSIVERRDEMKTPVGEEDSDNPKQRGRRRRAQLDWAEMIIPKALNRVQQEYWAAKKN